MTIRIFIRTLLLAGGCLGLVACTTDPAACGRAGGVALQVLGSGGPIADDGRAATGYLLWEGGRSRVLIDAGGGVFLRFGEVGARFEDLDFIGLSHFHTDHSADFPALVKSGVFTDRKRSLPVAGPAGAGAFPGLEAFLRTMLGGDGGAYAYLGSFLTGTDSKPMITAREIADGEATVAFTSEDLKVDALHVPHGIVPAVAFRVEIGGEVFVFASDQNGGDPAFAEFASGASVLVMHMVVPEDVTDAGRSSHAPPGILGEIAARAAPDKLVLSHFMARSLEDLDGNVARVAERYRGEIVVANDLACVMP